MVATIGGMNTQYVSSVVTVISVTVLDNGVHMFHRGIQKFPQRGSLKNASSAKNCDHSKNSAECHVFMMPIWGALIDASDLSYERVVVTFLWSKQPLKCFQRRRHF